MNVYGCILINPTTTSQCSGFALFHPDCSQDAAGQTAENYTEAKNEFYLFKRL